MVASVNSDPYSPFQHPITTEEGPQSSEEGSGLHSPVLSAQFTPVNGDSFRYHHDHPDVQHAAGILATQFDYSPPLNVQQHPGSLRLELPNSSAHNVTFHSDFPVSPRNQQSISFPVQSLSSRIQPPSAKDGGLIDYRYSPTSERRLPGGQSYDQSYPRSGANVSGMPKDGDHRPPPVSPTEHDESSSPTASASRKEISTVVIACRQCRGRKIRCDSTRPVCLNCVRRSNNCEYDAAPKRRGPDKRPGTRQRSCKKRPADGSAAPPSKRKRISVAERSSDARDSGASSAVKKEMPDPSQSPTSASRQPDYVPDDRPSSADKQSPPASGELRISPELAQQDSSSPAPRRHPPYKYDASYASSTSYGHIAVNVPQSPQQSHHPKFPSLPPSMLNEQRAWWHNFLGQYPLNNVAADLEYLFVESDSGHWLSFLNFQDFRVNLWDPEKRLNIQPSFVLAGLAMASLMKSSQLEYGVKGRERAIWFRNRAYECLHAALSSEWREDATLAGAALILVLYESSAHPQYSPNHVLTSLATLDDIINNLGLLHNDADAPNVTNFSRASVPIVESPGSDDVLKDKQCLCIPPDSITPRDDHSSWSYPLPWDPNWTPLETRNEECRRLCWCALAIVANFTAQCAAFDRPPPMLHLSDPSNYVLYFPGEVLDELSPMYRSVSSHSGTKESVWALYCRSMLLWSYCNSVRYDPARDDEEKSEFAHEAWGETQFIMDALEFHTCNLDTSLSYMSREYIYNTRMAITHVLRSLQGLETRGPVFNRRQAEEWIHCQEQVMNRVEITIAHITKQQGHQLIRRPFHASWFSNQLSICLMLWNNDHSLVSALKLAKSLLVPVDVMNALWPCNYLHRQTLELREQLTKFCEVVGLDPPLPPQYSLPRALQSN